MFGKLSHDEIEGLIKQEYIGRLGCHAEDTTYVVPISYAYDGTYIYGLSHDGMKINIMRKNPKVCFEVDNTMNLANWQSVIAWGQFEELEDSGDRQMALQKLIDRTLPVITSETMHITPQWPFPMDHPENIKGIVFRIKLTEKTGRFEKSPDQFFFAS